MTNIDWNRAACTMRSSLFNHDALDYDPRDEDYADLTPQQHAEHALDKENVEAAAKAVCASCPMLSLCRSEAIAASGPAYGVTGGLTAAELRALRNPNLIADDTDDEYTEEPQPVVADRDRGTRGQVNDEAVGRLTRAGWDSPQIAEELGCSVRTVARARARLRKLEQATSHEVLVSAEEQVIAAAEEQVAAVVADEITTAVEDLIADVAHQGDTIANQIGQATRVADDTPVATVSPLHATTPLAARRLSPAMAAVYDALADGHWHHRSDLLDLATPLVDADHALAWFNRKNPEDTRTSRQERIRRGAREVVANALTASARNRGRTVRDPQNPALYRIANAAALPVAA